MRQRQPDHEFASLSCSFAVGGDASPMHLGKPLDERESDPKAAFGACQRTVALRKEMEHLGDVLRRDSNSGVTDLDDEMGSRFLCREPDVAAGWRVLRRVGQQVDDNLFDPRRVAQDGQVQRVA